MYCIKMILQSFPCNIFDVEEKTGYFFRILNVVLEDLRYGIK